MVRGVKRLSQNGHGQVVTSGDKRGGPGVILFSTAEIVTIFYLPCSSAHIKSFQWYLCNYICSVKLFCGCTPQYGSADVQGSSACAKAVNYRTLCGSVQHSVFFWSLDSYDSVRISVFINKLIGCHKNLKIWLLSSLRTQCLDYTNKKKKNISNKNNKCFTGNLDFFFLT